MKKLFILLLGAVVLGMTACDNTPKAPGNPNQQSGQVDSADFYFKRAVVEYDREQVAQALLDVNKSIDLNPENVDAYMLLSELYYYLGDEAGITTALDRAMELDPFDTRPMVKMAELSLLQQNYNLAFGFIGNALDINTFNPEAYYVKGMIYLAKQDTAMALKNLLIAREQDAEFYDPQREICGIYLAQNDPLAVNFMRSLVEQFPNQPKARYDLALYLQDHGAPEEALAHYDTLLTQQPNNSRLLFNKGYVYFIYLNDNEQALNYFDQALQSDPDYVDALYNKGHVYERMGNFAQAKAIYSEVLNRYPSYQLAVDAMKRVKGR